MPTGKPAIDTSTPATPAALATATAALGAAPAFWGRYVHAPGQIDIGGHRSTVNYAPAEGALLYAHHIKLLPIARQTPAVGGTQAQGRADAQKNAAALFEAISPAYLYGAAPDVLVFLDVEHDRPLAADYYAGWSDELSNQGALLSASTVALHPAIYMSQGDTPTARALNQAVSHGALCAGAWIARYPRPVCAPPPPWDDALVTPSGGLPCPILAWQYSNSCDGLDASQTNPAHEAILLSRLPLPPGAALVA